jgi:hypothetical protein
MEITSNYLAQSPSNMAFVLAPVLEAFQAASVAAGIQGGFWL